MSSQFWSVTEGLAPPLWYPQRYNLNGNLEDIAPTTDFACTRCLWRTWQFSPGELRTRALQWGAGGSTDWARPPRRIGRSSQCEQIYIIRTFYCKLNIMVLIPTSTNFRFTLWWHSSNCIRTTNFQWEEKLTNNNNNIKCYGKINEKWDPNFSVCLE